MMSAVLSNPGHPEYGVATIPFPIPRDQYTYCMELLAALEIGDAVNGAAVLCCCCSCGEPPFFRKLKRGWYQNMIPTSSIKSFNFLGKMSDKNI